MPSSVARVATCPMDELLCYEPEIVSDVCFSAKNISVKSKQCRSLVVTSAQCNWQAIRLIQWTLEHHPAMNKQPRSMTTGQTILTGLCLLIGHIVLLPASAMQQAGTYIQGRVIVQFAEGAVPFGSQAKAGISSFDKAGIPFNIQSVRQAFPTIEAAAAKRELSGAALELRRMYVVEYSGPADAWKVANALMRSREVEKAEPYFTYQLAGAPAIGSLPVNGTAKQAEPNDARYSQQVHLDRLEMEGAWDVVRGSDGDVVIAVVDGGTDWKHPDLMDNVWSNPGETPGNGVDDDNNGFVDDVHGWDFQSDSGDPTGASNTPSSASHGTAVAGVAAAVTNNSIGIAGTSWNAKFMAINTACSPEIGDGSLCFGIEGTVYAAENGADVITASYGSPNPSFASQAAMRFAVERGAVVVAAAGNEPEDVDRVPHYPASYPETLSVGGTQKDSDRWANQAYGRSVDVVAASLSVDVTTPGSSYDEQHGTSFAVPLIAGIVSLVQTQRPEFGPFEVMEQVKQTADNIDDAQPLSHRGKMGRGRANARRAVTEEAAPGIRLADIELVDSDGNLDLEPGESFVINASFINFGGASEELMIGFAVGNRGRQFVSVTSPMRAAGAVPRLGSFAATFELEVSDPAPFNYLAELYVTVKDGEFEATSDLIRVPVNIRGLRTMTSSKLVASITDEGNIGFVDNAGDPGFGRGFQIIDKEGFLTGVLYEGGLMIGTSAMSLVDCVRSDVLSDIGTSQNTHFEPVAETSITKEVEHSLATQVVTAQMLDSGADTPLGVHILQEGYLDSTEGNEEFLVLQYTVTNTNEDKSLNGMWLGLFLDWDIGAPFSNKGTFDSESQVGMVFDGEDAVGGVGVKVLTNNAGFSHEVFDGAITYPSHQESPGYTADEKWGSMSGGIGTTDVAGVDVAQVIGAGPFNLKPQQSAVAAFALIAGRDEREIINNAASAQRFWDNQLNVNRVSSEAGPPTTDFQFSSIYPNPGNDRYSLSFTLPEASDVDLVIYNALSQEVRALVREPRSAGKHVVVWDGTYESGAKVASGVYFARLVAQGKGAEQTGSQSLVVVR